MGALYHPQGYLFRSLDRPAPYIPQTGAIHWEPCTIITHQWTRSKYTVDQVQRVGKGVFAWG